MSFLKRLFGSAPASTPMQQPSKHTEQQMRGALSALARSQRMDQLLDRLASVDVAWDFNVWLTAYDARATATVEDINHEVGEFWFLLHEFDRLSARVPADIAAGMPANVKRDKVKQYWDSAVQDAVDEFEPLVVSWERLTAVGVPVSEAQYREVHLWSDRAGLYYLVFLLVDIHSTLALWNGNEPASVKWRQKAAAYEAAVAESLVGVRSAFRRLKTERPEPFEGLGFTDSMLKFMGLGDLAS
jgi:hypothetical protein